MSDIISRMLQLVKEVKHNKIATMLIIESDDTIGISALFDEMHLVSKMLIAKGNTQTFSTLMLVATNQNILENMHEFLQTSLNQEAAEENRRELDG